MNVRLVHGDLGGVACDALVVNLFEGVTAPAGATGAADRALDGLISAAIAAGDFKGEFGKTLTLYSGGKVAARKVIVAGLGKADRFDLRRARLAAERAARAAQEGGARSLATIAHGAGIGGLDPVLAAQATVDGTLTGLYRFKGYRSSEPAPAVGEVLLVERDAAKAAALQAGIERGRIIAEGVNFARDLGNEPGNKLTPTEAARRARAMAEQAGLECEVLEREDCERLGMGLFTGVAQGSVEPPKVVVLRYRGQGGTARPLALVGKGITFDTGGIDLKDTDSGSLGGMWNMKFDMMGAGAVLGAMLAIGRLKPKNPVLAICMFTENMLSGSAQKPGDVRHALSGKTVELRSPDAEGRLVLGDGVAYAARLGAGKIADAATLTGAVNTALGSQAFACVANDPAWEKEVLAAAEAATERCWPLPNYEEYREALKSPVADMTNGGGRAGAGVQMGAIFIMEHAMGVPLAHLDIASTAWTREGDAYATGVAVRTLVALAERYTG